MPVVRRESAVHRSPTSRLARGCERSPGESDPAKRYELYKRAEQILCEEEAAMAPIYYYMIQAMVKPHLKRTFSPLGGEHFEEWKIVE